MPHCSLRTLGATLLFALFVGNARAQPLPVLDFGCASLSHAKDEGRLLVTDQAGRAFLGDFDQPLRTRIEVAGDLVQARFMAGGSRILLHYRSGAVEVVDARRTESVLVSLPPFTYVDLRVSDDGRWAVALPPGATRVDVLALDAGDLRKVGAAEHPLGAAMKLGGVSSEQGLAALIDERGAVQLLELVSARLLRPASIPTKGVKAVAFLEDHLWVTEDAGLMPIGTAYPLPGRARKAVEGVPITRSARLLRLGDGDHYIASDDLGFAQVLRRRPATGAFEFEDVGTVRLMPGLADALSDAAVRRIALCGSSLETADMATTAPTLRERARPHQAVYVESMDAAGRAVVRDLSGRAALWDNRRTRFTAALPRLPLQVFPAFSLLHGSSQAFLSFGQRDVLTISRATKGAGDSPGPYQTMSVPVISSGPNDASWSTRIVRGGEDRNEAYIVRPRTIEFLSWTGAAQGPPQKKSILAAGPTTCSEFTAAAVVSTSGRHLAVACDEGVAIFRLDQARRVALITPAAWRERSERVKVWVPSISFAADESILAFGVRMQHLFVDPAVDLAGMAGRSSVVVYDMAKQKMSELPPAWPVPVTAVAIAADGRQIWVGGRWGSVIVIDRSTGALVQQLRGIHGTVFGIQPDRSGGAHVWTDFGNLARISSGPERRMSSNVAFFPRAMVRREGTQVEATHDSDAAVTLVAIRPADLLTRSAPAPELQVDLAVPEKYRQPAQVLLYENGDVVSSGRVLSGRQEGRLSLVFDMPAGLSGELSVGLYSEDGGANVSLGEVTGGAQRLSGRLVGAFVGIGTYDSPSLQRLPYASGDAQALAKGLQGANHDLRVFPLAQAPDREKVMFFLQQVRDSAGPGDTLVLHLSGHGLKPTSQSQFTFAVKDTRPEDTSQRTGITSKDLIDLIAQGRQGATLLVLDTCNSGAFIDGILADPRIEEGPLTLGAGGRSLADTVAVIAAAPDVDVAKEGYKGRGLLTGVLLEGLESLGRRSPDGTVTQAQLLRYIDLNLARVARIAFPTKKQEPVLRIATRDFALRGQSR
jgi:hypothetical protein